MKKITIFILLLQVFSIHATEYSYSCIEYFGDTKQCANVSEHCFVESFRKNKNFVEDSAHICKNVSNVCFRASKKYLSDFNDRVLACKNVNHFCFKSNYSCPIWKNCSESFNKVIKVCNK